MTRFSYTAVAVGTATGALVTGRQEATDEGALRVELRRRGLVPIEVRPVSVIDAARALLSSDRLRSSDRVWFFQTLRLLLAGNVPVEPALSTMYDLAASARLKRICGDVREKVRGGTSLSEAVAAVAGLAAPQHIALLRSGLESGRLAHTAALIDTSLATSQRIRRTVVGRLIYPMILLAAAVLAVWFLATFVIPRFAETLEAMGGELPLSTLITLRGADVMFWAGPPFMVVVVATIVFRNAWLTPRLRARLSKVALRTPLIGGLVWHGQGAVIADVLATMAEGGADIVTGLDQAYEVVSSPVIAERLGAARKAVREGMDLGAAFSQHAVLPPLASAVVQVGVRSGDLVGGLRRASDLCLDRQERTTERLLVLMEPAVVVFMASAVGWLVYSLVMGMLAMNDLRGL